MRHFVRATFCPLSALRSSVLRMLSLRSWLIHASTFQRNLIHLIAHAPNE
jgi:hypothetical protein